MGLRDYIELTALGLDKRRLSAGPSTRYNQRYDSRHAHREALDHNVIIERFENVSTYKRQVNSRITIVLQVR